MKEYESIQKRAGDVLILAKKTTAYQKMHQAFTIVEVLVVVVVIAILATITLVLFNGTTNRAYDAAVTHDMANFSKKLLLFHVENNRFPHPSMTDDIELLSIEYKASSGMYMILPDVQRNLVYCTSPDRQQFAFVARSKSGNSFYMSTSTGGVVKPYPDPWNAGTYAADICTSPAINLSASESNQRTGYWPSHGGWQPWTKLQ